MVNTNHNKADQIRELAERAEQIKDDLGWLNCSAEDAHILQIVTTCMSMCDLIRDLAKALTYQEGEHDQTIPNR